MRLSRTAGITLARVDPAWSMAIVRRLRDARSGPTEGPCGGIGRRARLKIEFRKECWFDSGQGHHASPFRASRGAATSPPLAIAISLLYKPAASSVTRRSSHERPAYVAFATAPRP